MFTRKKTIGFIAFLYVNSSPIIMGLLIYDSMVKFFERSTVWSRILALSLLLILYVIAWICAWNFFRKEKNVIKYKLGLYFFDIMDFYANVYFFYYFLVLFITLLPLIMSLLMDMIGFRPIAVIILNYDQMLREYIVPFILSFSTIFWLMYANKGFFGKSLELMSLETIISNEIDYLLEYLRKRDAVYRDILKGKFSEKNLEIYASELFESLENLRTSLEKWLFSYTATPYEIDLHDIFEKLLIHVLTTDDLQPIEDLLRTIKEIITKKRRSELAQIELINSLRSLYEKTRENSFLKFLSKEETSVKVKVLSAIITFFSALTFSDMINILKQLSLVIKYNLPEIIYMGVLLLAIFLPLFLYVLLVYKTATYLINVTQRYFFFRRLKRKRFRKSSKAPDLFEKKSENILTKHQGSL